jgi:hypothetical protein
MRRVVARDRVHTRALCAQGVAGKNSSPTRMHSAMSSTWPEKMRSWQEPRNMEVEHCWEESGNSVELKHSPRITIRLPCTHSRVRMASRERWSKCHSIWAAR